MKKLFIVALIALFVVGAFGYVSYAKNPSGPGYSGDIMGMQTGRYASDPQRTFRLVRWAPSSGTFVLTADSAVIWDRTYDDGVTIGTTTVSNDSGVAGIIVTAINSSDTTGQVRLASDDVGKGNWGYLQTYGYCATARVAGTAPLLTAGDAIGCGVTPSGISRFTADVASGAGNGNMGVALDTVSPSSNGTADQRVEVFLRCE